LSQLARCCCTLPKHCGGASLRIVARIAVVSSVVMRPGKSLRLVAGPHHHFQRSIACANSQPVPAALLRPVQASAEVLRSSTAVSAPQLRQKLHNAALLSVSASQSRSSFCGAHRSAPYG